MKDFDHQRQKLIALGPEWLADSMYALTGVEGRYDPHICQYNPPAGFRMWREVVAHEGCRLRVEGHLSVPPAM